MNQAELFDPSRTVATACPVPGCGAVRLPQQERVPTCAHDLETERRRPRPRTCLNAIDPQHQQIPY